MFINHVFDVIISFCEWWMLPIKSKSLIVKWCWRGFLQWTSALPRLMVHVLADRHFTWRQSSIAHWTAWHHTVWLQTYDCLSDMPSRRRLRSSLTHQLDVHQSQCATVGDRTFAVTGAHLWNSLPPDVVACDTLPRFRREHISLSTVWPLYFDLVFSLVVVAVFT